MRLFCNWPNSSCRLRRRFFSFHFRSDDAQPACRLRGPSLRMQENPITIPGLTARLDKLCHHDGGPCLPADKPHAFVYFITISNQSDHTVTLLGRKWVIENADGTFTIVEGDRIVGEIPRLAPGESFSYNSCHMTSTEGVAKGCFHGVDDLGRRISVPLPAFPMRIPHAREATGLA